MEKYEGYYLRQFNNLCILPKEYIKRGKIAYFEEFLTLDTETSHIPYVLKDNGQVDKEKALTWVYQFAICSYNALYTGRTCREIKTFYDNLLATNDIDNNCRLVTYIHNASYDLSYLIPYFSEWGQPKVIAIATHKIISLSYDNGLVFKCSYKLSNKSLEGWSSDLGTEHKKLIGYVDYNAIHYQDSELTQNDWYYQFNDVIVLRECLLKQFAINNHNVATTPLTSTGYIREMTYKSYREAINKEGNKIRDAFTNAYLTTETYTVCKNEMSGGITHGNRRHANKRIDPRQYNKRYNKSFYIKHRDFDSHYPTNQICHEKGYPIGRFIHHYHYDKLHSFSIQDIFALTKEKCVMIDIIIKDLKLKDKNTVLPYAQYSHFTRHDTKDNVYITDNGRILQMNGMSKISVNEIDLKWLVKQYKFDYIITDVYTSTRGNLPSWLTDVIKELYKKKTDYKNAIKKVKEEKQETFEMEIELLRIKALLNSIYGMSATDIIRLSYTVDELGQWKVGEEIENIGEIIANYYKGKKNCMRFEWGCYTTSWARDELMTFYELITSKSILKDNAFLYADTDSIFYISDDELEAVINNYNKELEQKSLKMGWYVTLDNGKIKTFNRFDDEEDDIKIFKFLHAKCYAMECGDNNKLECTVAGVPKRILTDNGYYYREDELGSIDNLQQDFTFYKLGGTECRYFTHKPYMIEYNGHVIDTGGGAIINNTTKTLKDLDIYEI